MERLKALNELELYEALFDEEFSDSKFFKYILITSTSNATFGPGQTFLPEETYDGFCVDENVTVVCGSAL